MTKTIICWKNKMSKGLCPDIIVIALEDPALPVIEFATDMKAVSEKAIAAKW